MSGYEAARVLGCGPLRALLVGVWPPLRLSCVLGGSLVALYALFEFGAIALLRFDAFSRVIYLQLSAAFDRTGAAVCSLLLVVSIVFVLILSERLAKGTTAEKERVRPLAVCLGALRWPAVGFSLGVAARSFSVPLVGLFYRLRAHPGGLSWLPGALLVSVGMGALSVLVREASS